MHLKQYLYAWASEVFFSKGGAVGDFPNFFPGGPKVVKFGFYSSKLKKQPFLLIVSNSRGGPRNTNRVFPTFQTDKNRTQLNCPVKM